MTGITADTLEMAEQGRRLVSDFETITGPEFHARAVEAMRALALAVAGEGYDFRDAMREAMADAEAAGADELSAFYGDQA